MPGPDFQADPETDPYRVLGIDPTGGPDAYLPRAKVKERAKAPSAKHKNDKSNYRAIQLAMNRAVEIHPEQSSNGVWRVPLSIGVEQRPVTVGESVAVEVTDFCGAPIADDGSRRATVSRSLVRTTRGRRRCRYRCRGVPGRGNSSPKNARRTPRSSSKTP
jgi:hypothetical protein